MAGKKSVIDCLSEMVRLYGLGLDLTRKALADKNLPGEDRLGELLHRRAEVLARISRLERGLETKTEGDRKYLAGLSQPEAEQAHGLVEDLRRAMTALAEADLNLKARLEDEMDQVGQELRRLRRGHSALKAYAPFRGGIAYYVDRQS